MPWFAGRCAEGQTSIGVGRRRTAGQAPGPTLRDSPAIGECAPELPRALLGRAGFRGGGALLSGARLRLKGISRHQVERVWPWPRERETREPGRRGSKSSACRSAPRSAIRRCNRRTCLAASLITPCCQSGGGGLWALAFSPNRACRMEAIDTPSSRASSACETPCKRMSVAARKPTVCTFIDNHRSRLYPSMHTGS